MMTSVPPSGNILHHRVARGLMGPHHIYECRRTNIMGSLVQDASPFLFPCTIEYSLICAAILYVMWKNISRISTPVHPTSLEKMDKVPPFHYKRSPHHYSVDCAQAHKGLFVGEFSIISILMSRSAQLTDVQYAPITCTPLSGIIILIKCQI